MDGQLFRFSVGVLLAQKQQLYITWYYYRGMCVYTHACTTVRVCVCVYIHAYDGSKCECV